MSSPRLLRSAALAVVCLLVLSSCGDDDTTSDSGATTTTSQLTTPSPTTGTDTQETVATLFFLRDEKVAAAGEALEDPAEPRDVMEALLGGPDEFETDIGMQTEIPEGTQLLGVEVDGGEAIVDLSSEFESGGGSLSMQARVGQVVFTLTAIDSIESVSIRIAGEDVDAIGGEGVPARDLTREDMSNVTPLVLVTSPLPDEEVESPLTITGIANTFEATVQYTVTDPEGLIIAEGFTTATAGNGTWGTFEVEVDFETSREGLGAVIAFQQDAETGGQRDVYEVPVRMG